MPRDGNPPRELIPRSTVEEIVGHRNRALELYAEAFTAIEAADQALQAAHAMADRAAGGVKVYTDNQIDEIAQFQKAVRMPNANLFSRVARRLTDMAVWQWVIERTDLERLMDHEAKEKLREQMRYLPSRRPERRWTARSRTALDDGASLGELIHPEDLGEGMPLVSVENIYATIEQFAQDADHIWRRGIANAFSKLDRRFRSHDGFKVGSRIILTYAFSDGGSLTRGRVYEELLDIERAFSVLDHQHIGASYGGAVGQINDDRRNTYGPSQSLTETRYFKVRGYKNGNAHLWFTRDDLVLEINKILAEWYGEVIGDSKTKEDIFSGSEFRLPARRFGFFPTPPQLAEKVISETSLYRKASDPPLLILEPSAGTGNLARLLATACRHGASEWDPDSGERIETPGAPYGNKVDCIELQPELATALESEGIYNNVRCADFLTVKPDPKYDRIVMNPPFDLERDCDHVMHALKFLKEGGELVAIMSAGVEFRETPKAIAFRAEMKRLGGIFDDLPAGSFSSVGTNTNTVLIKVSTSHRYPWHNGLHRF